MVCTLTDSQGTQLGDPVVVVQALHSTGLFRTMTMSQDEAEHSIEMQLPYLRKVCEG